jgi:transposase
MATALSMDLRIRVLDAIDAGVSCRQAARRFGSARPVPSAGTRCGAGMATHVHSDMAATAARIGLRGMRRRSSLYLSPNLTSSLPEMKAALAEKGLSFGVTSLWRFFARHRIRLKKTAHALEQNRPDVLM